MEKIKDTNAKYVIPEVQVVELTTERLICDSPGGAGGGGEEPEGD